MLDTSRRLLRQGMIVFLLGLATGLVMVVAIKLFENPRLALAGPGGGRHAAAVPGGSRRTSGRQTKTASKTIRNSYYGASGQSGSQTVDGILRYWGPDIGE